MAKTKKGDPRFKKGEKVWVDFGDSKPEQKTIEDMYKPITGIWMYSFKGSSIACGENYLRRKLTDKKLTISECLGDGDEHVTKFNTFAFKRGTPYLDSEANRKAAEALNIIFFEPDMLFVEWLIKYAAGRLIIDIGCGCGHLMKMINARGGKVMGIEPNIDAMSVMAERMASGQSMMHIMQQPVEDCGPFLKTLGEKALLIFARPCHSQFVENGIAVKHPKQEVLYITKPENLKQYNDLGKFKNKAKKIKHEGSSKDNEIVYSIK